MQVTSPCGNTLHSKENVTHSQFGFTTNEAGQYLSCFWVDKHGTGAVSINLDWKTGIAAKDWESVARKERIEGVELEHRKLEGAVEAIHENLLYLKSREADMRIVSEITNSRVAWYCFYHALGHLHFGFGYADNALNTIFPKEETNLDRLILSSLIADYA